MRTDLPPSFEVVPKQLVWSQCCVVKLKGSVIICDTWILDICTNRPPGDGAIDNLIHQGTSLS